MHPAIAKHAAALACPLCRGGLSPQGGSLLCPRGHCFDVARQGYVNLALKPAHPGHYSRESFACRRQVLEGGLYAPIAQWLRDFLADHPALRRVLDAGCGEGYYPRQLQTLTDLELFAFDLSRDSVRLAAQGDRAGRVCWFVGDLAAIPLRDGSMDAILNLFSPANYGEFLRLLAPGGCVIKAIPAPEHLQEVRALAQGQLARPVYSGQAVAEHFAAAFPRRTRARVAHTFPLTPSLREALLAMTPLLFHVDREQIDWSGLTQATIAADLLVGWRP